MITKIKYYLFVAVSSAMLVLPLTVPAAVYAAAGGGSCQGISKGIGAGAGSTSTQPVNCGGDQSTTNQLGKLAEQAVTLFSFIVGAIAVIMIIYGGFRYITSGGDSNSVGAAKNTLIYAIVGLIIVALAQIIVRFVLNTTDQTVNPT